MEDRIYIDIADINQLKSLYGKTTADMVWTIDENRDKLSNCPDFCELEEFFKDVYSK